MATELKFLKGSESMKKFLDVEDVMNILSYKRSMAYAIIRKLNKELSEQGFITKPGVIPAKYLAKRYGLEN